VGLNDTLASLVVAPDGCALDAEGALWIADALNGRAIRVREGGDIVQEITVGTGVFACGLGGADGRTLFICAAPDFDEHARAAARAGQLLSTGSRSRTLAAPDRPAPAGHASAASGHRHPVQVGSDHDLAAEDGAGLVGEPARVLMRVPLGEVCQHQRPHPARRGDLACLPAVRCP